MKTEQVQEQINALKEKVSSIKAELENEIYNICEQLDFINSSRFTYNIDNFRKFEDDLNNFEIK